MKIDGSGPALSRGLPIAKAIAPETLLAFAMNGQPLPLLHGGPLRVVAPGYPGSAWQKWLAAIVVRDREHDGEKMRGLDYRLPRVPDAGTDPALYDVITDMPVKSLIASPGEGARLPAGETVKVAGQAWSGHGRVTRLEVSGDGGANWTEARLGEAGGRFGWRGFEARLELPAGSHVLMARAHDDRGQVQPLEPPGWNPKGYCNNQAQRVAVTVA
jgi:DMSO/TMAO reductase YedYZ molybdopterin-dependent catalytic subunit